MEEASPTTERRGASNLGMEVTKKCNFGQIISERVIQLSVKLIKSNQLIGRVAFMSLIILENIIIALMLLKDSYPGVGIKLSELQGNQTYFKDIVDTRSLELFSFNKNHNPNDTISGSFLAPSMTIFSLCLLMAVIMTIQISLSNSISSSTNSSSFGKSGPNQSGNGTHDNSNDNSGNGISRSFGNSEEPEFLSKILAVWMTLHRRILTFFISFALVDTSLLLKALNTEAVQDSTSKYFLILMLALGVLSFILTYLMSFLAMRLPINVSTIPWNCSQTPTIQLRELLKVLFIVQDYFLREIPSSSYHAIQSTYFAFVVLCLFILVIYNPPKYFDTGIDSTNKICSRVLLCIAFLCFVRCLLVVSIIEVAVYSPIVFYAGIKGLQTVEDKAQRQIMKMVMEVANNNGNSIANQAGGAKKNAQDSFLALQYISQIAQNLQGLSNISSEGQAMSTHFNLTSDQEYFLQHLHEIHRLQCFKVPCICRHYHYITSHIFKNQPDESMQLLNDNNGNDVQDNMQGHNGILGADSSYFGNNMATRPHMDNYQSFYQGELEGPIGGPGSIEPTRHMLPDLSEEPTIQSAMGQQQQPPNSMIGRSGNYYASAGNTGDFRQYQQNYDISLRKLLISNNLGAYDSSNGTFKDQQSGIVADEWRSQLKTVEDYESKNEFRQAIKKFQFKDVKEASSYYFLMLLGTILESFNQQLQTSNQSQDQDTTWLEFRLLYAQFLTKFMKRPFLAVYGLIKIDQRSSFKYSQSRSLSILARIKFKVCESLILSDALDLLTQNLLQSAQATNANKWMNQSSVQHSAIMISEFIERSNFVKQLDDIYDEAAVEINDFWKLWTVPEPSLTQLFKKARDISQSIQQIKLMTSRIENDSVYLLGDEDRHKLRIYFHQDMLNDPHTANDMYNKQQIRHQFIEQRNSGGRDGQKNGVFNQTEKSSRDFDHSFKTQGICVVSIRSMDIQQLDFTYVNKAFQFLTGYKDTQLIGSNIKLIMPDFFRSHHDQFMTRFFYKGQSRILGKDRALFVSDQQGFIKPIDLKIEFSYDQIFRYAFISTAKQIEFLKTSTEDCKQIPISDAMIFLTDEDNIIHEINRNVLTFTCFEGSLDQYRNSQEGKGRKLTLDQMIVNFHRILEQATNNNSTNDQNNLYYESNNLQNFTITNQLVEVKLYDENINDFSEHKVFRGVMSCIQECYYIGREFQKVAHRVFIIVPLHKHPDFDALSQNFGLNAVNSASGMSEVYNPNMKSSNFKETFLPGGFGKSGQIDPIDPGYKGRVSQPMMFDESKESGEISDQGLDLNSQSSGYSSGSSSSDSNYFHKSLFFTRKTPRTLLICVIILSLMLFSFLVVSVYNLLEFIMKHQVISNKITTYTMTTRRNLDLRYLLLDLHVLHQIGIYPNEQNYVPKYLLNQTIQSRLQLYKDSFSHQLDDIRELTTDVDIINVLQNADQSFDMSQFDTIYLSEEGRQFIKKSSFKSQLNLYLTYMEMLDINALISEKPALNISSYDSVVRNATNKATQTERQLYFLFMNGMNRLEERAYQQSQLVFDLCIEQSRSSRNTMNISAYISVAIVTVILLGIIPLIVNIQRRRYHLIKFLLYIPKSSLDATQIKCQTYLHRLKTFKQNQNSPLFLLDQQNSFNETHNSVFKKFNKSYKDKSSKKLKSGVQKQGTSSPFANQHHKESKIGMSQFTDINAIKKKKHNNDELEEEFKEPPHSKKSVADFGSLTKSQQQKLRRSQYQVNEAPSDEEDETPSSEDIDGKDHHLKKRKKKKEGDDKLKELDADQMAQENKAGLIQSQVSSQNCREKFKILVAVALFIAYLNSSLLVSTLYANSVFENYEASSSKIKIIYARESCTSNILLFMRNQLITNKTTTSYFYSNSFDYVEVEAVQNLIRFCLTTEGQLSDMKNTMPKYFAEAGDIILKQDQPQICNATYISKEPQRIPQCEAILDGLLTNGVDAAISYLVSLMTQLNINYLSNPAQRTPQFLRDNLNNVRLTEMTDLSIFFLRDIFKNVENIVVDSLRQYFDKEKIYYLLIFCVYATLTVSISIFIGVQLFGKVKRRILEIQNILIIFPLADLQILQKNEIEKFLSS